MDDFDLTELVTAAARLQQKWENEGFEFFEEVETLAQLKEEPEIVPRLRQLREELTN